MRRTSQRTPISNRPVYQLTLRDDGQKESPVFVRLRRAIKGFLRAYGLEMLSFDDVSPINEQDKPTSS